VVITLPLLEGLDGVQKMSKSLGNYVGIDEPAGVMFGKIMSVSDTLMLRYYELLTDITPDALNNLKPTPKFAVLGFREPHPKKVHPKKVKEKLAMELVTRYHGQFAAEQAAMEFDKIHREGGLPDIIDEVIIPPFEMLGGRPELLRLPKKVKVTKHWLPRILVKAGLAPSTSDAKRLIIQGGVQVDGEKVTDDNLELAVGKSYILKVGKRRFKQVTLSD
jgi:tyrosyl-tRNA synthetase